MAGSVLLTFPVPWGSSPHKPWFVVIGFSIQFPAGSFDKIHQAYQQKILIILLHQWQTLVSEINPISTYTFAIIWTRLRTNRGFPSRRGRVFSLYRNAINSIYFP